MFWRVFSLLLFRTYDALICVFAKLFCFFDIVLRRWKQAENLQEKNRESWKKNFSLTINVLTSFFSLAFQDIRCLDWDCDAWLLWWVVGLSSSPWFKPGTARQDVPDFRAQSVQRPSTGKVFIYKSRVVLSLLESRNALAWGQRRVHEPVDHWDITFCTCRFWGF